MSGLFSSCSKITDLAPLANWDVSNVKILGNTW
jgi:surface protein